MDLIYLASKHRHACKELVTMTRQNKTTTAPPSLQPIPTLLFSLGLVLLLVAVGGAATLVWSHFSDSSLPGCGPGSPCDQATGSVWGRVPLINWPVSFLGLAYFIGMTVAWISARTRPFGLLPWIARLGVAFSLFYIGLMVVGNMLCPYCITSHVGNLGFLVALEFALAQRNAAQQKSDQPLLSWPALNMAIGFVSASIVLLGWQMQFTQQAQQAAERELESATEEMIADSGQPSTFTGRYLTGAENAPVRIVMFTNYQCIDCQRIEGDIDQILASRDDVSLSVKHYPMSTDCNPHMTRNMHSNSCWAARAVEAAGIIGGNERYWQMHHWLFNRRGGFTQPELRQGLLQMGFDPDHFISVMTGEETLRLVQEDIEEATQLGLHYTPMIFINGVELRGWNAPNAVRRTVERVAMSNPSPEVIEQTQPATAFEKFVNDWRENGIQMITATNSARTLGPEDAPVRVDVWGDYQNDLVVRADKLIREKIEERGDVYYVFRHFPVNEDCNPHTPRTMTEHGCWAARAAEAAAILHGQEGFWKMHVWLMENQSRTTNTALRQAARDMGFDAEQLINTMNSRQVTENILQDATDANRQNIRGLPRMLVNRRWVPRWDLEGYDVLGTIFDEAASQ